MKALHSIVLVALAGCAHVVSAEGDAVYYACYSTAGSMKEHITKDTFMARGACRTECVKDPGYSKLPNDAFKVEDAKCKQPCGGFATETCGSRLGEYFSVYVTGLEQNPDMDTEASSASSASKTKSSSRPSSTVPAAAATTDPSATATSEPNPINKASVAAGAVVGVLAIIGLGVGVWIFLRKRRRQKVEEEYRKSAAVRGFTQKPASDHRLDPGMVQKRDSVGSIADNQDYSRRILKAR
ncbi:hypothetical protein K440DRAFT_541866 [Wilcoxina mikolae CBS 423.85]|nr:hypothetical protein K440DRAFT_541866 [Wilcoxina mikolae CBS 423.85]